VAVFCVALMSPVSLWQRMSFNIMQVVRAPPVHRCQSESSHFSAGPVGHDLHALLTGPIDAQPCSYRMVQESRSCHHRDRMEHVSGV
jgi:hypothetical protein